MPLGWSIKDLISKEDDRIKLEDILRKLLSTYIFNKHETRGKGAQGGHGTLAYNSYFYY